jgi:hypothetical protein
MVKQYLRPVALLFFLLFLSIGLSSCSSTPQLASTWRIVGNIADYQSSEYEYFNKEKVGVEFSNDADNLYVTVKTIDHDTQMKIMHSGMTIWFDSTGGTEKIFGIHYPLGTAGVPAPNHARGSREVPDEMNDYSMYNERLHRALDQLEIIGPGPLDKLQTEIISAAQTHGINVHLRDTMGTLTCELAVPMSYGIGRRLAIGTGTGKKIGVGIFTELQQRTHSRPEGMPGGFSGGAPGGEMGGGMSGAHGHRRPEGSENPGETNTPIELWMKVKIAAGVKPAGASY